MDRKELTLIEEVDREAPIRLFWRQRWRLGALMGQRLSACFGVADRDERGTRELLPLRQSSLERQQQLRLVGKTKETPTLR